MNVIGYPNIEVWILNFVRIAVTKEITYDNEVADQISQKILKVEKGYCKDFIHCLVDVVAIAIYVVLVDVRIVVDNDRLVEAKKAYFERIDEEKVDANWRKTVAIKKRRILI